MKHAYLHHVIFKLFNIYNMIKSLYTPFFIVFLKITTFTRKINKKYWRKLTRNL